MRNTKKSRGHGEGQRKGRRRRVGMTVLELVVGVGVLTLILGIVFQVLPTVSRQERDLDRQAQFAQAAQTVFTLLKSDLRSLDRLRAGPARLDLTRVIGLSETGNEQIEPVSWVIASQGVTEIRGPGEGRLHPFLIPGEEALGRSFGGGFRLTGIRDEEGTLTGEVTIDLRVVEAGPAARPALVATLSVAVRGRALQALGSASPAGGETP